MYSRWLGTKVRGQSEVKLIIDTDIVFTEPLTMGVIESISEMGKLKVKDISKCSGPDKREAGKSSQAQQSKSKAHALPTGLSPLSDCFEGREPERNLLPSSTISQAFPLQWLPNGPKWSINSTERGQYIFFKSPPPLWALVLFCIYAFLGQLY